MTISTAGMIEAVRTAANMTKTQEEQDVLNSIANRIEILTAANAGMDFQLNSIRAALNIPINISVQAGVIAETTRLNEEVLSLRSQLSESVALANKLRRTAKEHQEENQLLRTELADQEKQPPFMYGIADPDGKAYFDEFCVSADRGLVEDAVNNLNHDREDGDELNYSAVALYRAPPLTSAEREELQRYRAAIDKPIGEINHDNGSVTWFIDVPAGALVYSPPPLPVVPEGLHPDTAKLVVDFATALAEKLHKAELKYSYDADWKRDGWPSQCQSHFHQHIAKGDPRDVAAYCAFMWYHGWKTESQALPVVPDEVTEFTKPNSSYEWRKGYNACIAAFQSGNPVWSGIDWAKGCNPTPALEGWALVPVTANSEMMAAAIACGVTRGTDGALYVKYDDIYAAMIAAVPQLRKDGDV